MGRGERHANKLWILLEQPTTVGQRIRYWRIAQDLSQQVLAERAGKAAGFKDGLTKSFLSLLEAGRTKPSVASLSAVAQVLDLSLDYLVTGQTRRRAMPPIRVSVKKKRAYVEERKVSKTKTLTIRHGPQVTITVNRPGEDGKPVVMSKTIDRKKAAAIVG